MSAMGFGTGDPATHAAVRMVARPASVPAARRFVTDVLSRSGHRELVGDVGLCVSELVTNATLHSGAEFFEIDLDVGPGKVRLAVLDAGTSPVDVLARKPGLSDAFLDEISADDAATTGRGLFLVSALAAGWGIEELPSGKRIWAEFPAGSEATEPTPSPPLVEHHPERPSQVVEPDAWVVVRFLGCPPGLVVAHDDNVAAYIRELSLIGDRIGHGSYRRLAKIFDDFIAVHAVNWEPARMLAHDAVREARDAVDIEITTSKNIRPRIELMRELLGECEALSEAGKLMTLPAPPPVQDLRDWLEEEFLAQGEQGLEPLPWPDWVRGVRR